jgi:hypothetical protein
MSQICHHYLPEIMCKILWLFTLFFFFRSLYSWPFQLSKCSHEHKRLKVTVWFVFDPGPEETVPKHARGHGICCDPASVPAALTDTLMSFIQKQLSITNFPCTCFLPWVLSASALNLLLHF